MGGFGSGRWSTGRPEVVEDARGVRLSDLPAPGHVRVHRWPDGGAAELARNDGVVTVRFALGGARHERRVVLAPAPLTFGTRWWFSCPRCTLLVGAVYFHGADLRCRHCLGLRYRSQYEGTVERAASEHTKACRKIGCDGIFDGGPPTRPTRMWRRTFATRLSKIEHTRGRWRDAVRAEVRRLIEHRDQLLSCAP